MTENKCESLNQASESSVSSAKSTGSKKADPSDEYAPGELRPLKSNVSDHKIKSIKGSSREASNGVAHLDELDKPKEGSVKLDDKKFEVASLSEQLKEPEASTVDLVPRPAELDEESDVDEPKNGAEKSNPVGQELKDDASVDFFRAIRKYISTGGGLEKAKKKQEYLGCLEAIQNYGKLNVVEAEPAKGAATETAETSSQFVKMEARSVNPDDSDLNLLDQNDFQVDYADSSTTVSESRSERSLNFSPMIEADANEPSEPVKQPSPKKVKKPKKKSENRTSFLDSNAVTVALYGTAGTILSAALYYLINR